MNFDDIILVIREELKRRKTTKFRAAIDAGLPGNAIRYILEGREPKVQRLIEVCDALGLEFYVGPPRPPNIVKEENTQKLLEEILSRLPEKNKISETVVPYDIQELEADAILEYDEADITKHRLPIFELGVAAGAGAFNEAEEKIVNYIAFRPDWLHKHGLQPDKCAIIRVRGDSMEPTLTDRCVILVDRNRWRRRTGHVYVIRTDDGLIVKRLGKDNDKNWLLVSDNPERDNILLPDNSEIIGEVRWTAKTLK